MAHEVGATGQRRAGAVKAQFPGLSPDASCVASPRATNPRARPGLAARGAEEPVPGRAGVTACPRL